MKTRRMTMAQALIQFLKNQYVERDGQQHAFFAGVLGIFGHGNVAGIGQALQQNPDFPYYLVRNEQSAVHMAAALCQGQQPPARLCLHLFDRARRHQHDYRRRRWPPSTACRCCCCRATSSPAATWRPCLQQLESPGTQDIGVNDCFKPVSRYWDRIYRPEQLITALPEVMRVLTSPSDCGAVTLALPQDVQTEAYDYPEELFRKRVWLIRRGQPDTESRSSARLRPSAQAAEPLIVAGGGVLMSEASQALDRFVAQTGIPVGETQAGKGSLAWDHPQSMGAIGATGTLAANRLAHSRPTS